MTWTHHFLNWERPALDQAADFLTRRWSGGLLDLSAWTIIVPTRHAGRRLRERLALRAGAQQAAVLPGIISAPELLFRPPETAQPLTDSLTALLLWREVIAAIKPGECPALFPAGHHFSSFTEQTALATQLRDLRDVLCEEGFTFASFAAHYTGNPEVERWQDLCELETAFMERIHTYGLRDACEAKLAAAANPLPELDTTHPFCVLFVPDPVPLAAQALQHLAQRTDIHICIHAPESLKDQFDELGRPRPDYWTTAPININTADIQLTQQPHRLMERISAHLSALTPEQRIHCTIGMPDSTMIPAMQEYLKSSGISYYDPAGDPVARGPLFRLISTLYALVAEPDYATFSTLVRLPVFLTFMKQRDPDFSSDAFLRALDKLQNNHIPPDYPAVRNFSAQDNWYPEVISVVDDMLNALAGNPATALQQVLRTLFAGRILKSNDPADSHIINTAEILRQKLAALKDGPVIDQLSPRDKLFLIVQELQKARITTDRPAAAVDLMGWLELHWEDAPQLLLCGMNDGLVPETVVGHAFLPDQACIENGLRNNTTRLSRDAYLLHAMIACRAPGQVIHLLSKQNFSADPLRPSRLLLMCPDDQLIARVERLFQNADDSVATPPHRHDWLLTPDARTEWNPPEKLSVSSLNTYLSSPFLFYLKHVLRMKPVDDRKEELDAIDFGDICHQALEAFGRTSTADSTNAYAIRDELLEQAERLFTARYGTELTIPLLLQKEALFGRLRAAAHIQANWRSDGWQIDRSFTEKEFTLPLPNGMNLCGRIDRIDRHPDGRICIMDYKTANTVSPPEKAHLGKPQQDGNEKLLATPKKQWINLQLPLYQLMFLEAFPQYAERITLAYFALPKASAQTEILPWAPFDSDLLQTARSCTEHCAQLIHDGIFWPPGKLTYDDEFKALLFGTPETTVNSAAMEALHA